MSFLLKILLAWLARLDPFQRARAAAMHLLDRKLVWLVDDRGAMRPLDECARAEIAAALAFAEQALWIQRRRSGRPP